MNKELLNALEKIVENNNANMPAATKIAEIIQNKKATCSTR
ncbi:hypothetical protein [Cytobacillus sp. IB215665]|nr:hypothetical protein [Cytobacillus sp. IB215665]MDX8367823.1 hypothetical protein [Cytobacillus sp. IB215665]